MTISKELEATLRQAIDEATRRRHEYLTLEHLLTKSAHKWSVSIAVLVLMVICLCSFFFTIGADGRTLLAECIFSTGTIIFLCIYSYIYLL